jgi:hypothetical protein
MHNLTAVTKTIGLIGCGILASSFPLAARIIKPLLTTPANPTEELSAWR